MITEFPDTLCVETERGSLRLRVSCEITPHTKPVAEPVGIYKKGDRVLFTDNELDGLSGAVVAYVSAMLILVSCRVMSLKAEAE